MERSSQEGALLDCNCHLFSALYRPERFDHNHKSYETPGFAFASLASRIFWNWSFLLHRKCAQAKSHLIPLTPEYLNTPLRFTLCFIRMLFHDIDGGPCQACLQKLTI